jgi:hypothetical protein
MPSTEDLRAEVTCSVSRFLIFDLSISIIIALRCVGVVFIPGGVASG